MNPNTAIPIQSGIYISSDGKAKDKDIEKCLHCGREAQYRTTFDHQIIAFCCSGCEAVFKILKQDQLGTYYDILAGMKRQAPSQQLNSDPAISSPTLNELHAIDTEQFRYSTTPSSYALFFPAFNCAACLWLVEKKLRSVPNLEHFYINLEKRLLVLTIPEAMAGPAITLVLRELSSVGYHGLPLTHDIKDHAGSERRKSQLIQLGISGAIFANVMLFSSSVYLSQLFDEKNNADLMYYFNVISFALATISMFTAGRSFFGNSLRSLKAKVIHIDLPIVAALLVAWTTSIYHLWTRSGGVYFDSISGLIFFLLLGRYLSESLISRARQLIDTHSQIAAETHQEHVGALIDIDHGVIIPADGVITQGEASLSETFLTGEAQAVSKNPGDLVYEGTLNLGSLFQMRVTAVDAETKLARLKRLISNVTAQRGPVEHMTQSIAKWFVAGTMLSAVAAAFVWSSAGFSVAFEVVCSVLIVSCPCALAMAIPLANALAVKRSWARGIIIRNVDAFEQAKKIDTIVFDKTGTLTTGHMEVIDTQVFSSGKGPSMTLFYGLIHQITKGSIHPVAKAVHRWSDKYPSTDLIDLIIKNHPGSGIESSCYIQDANFRTEAGLRLGSLPWLIENTQTAASRDFLTTMDQIENSNSICAALLTLTDSEGTHAESVVLFTLHQPLRHDAKEIIREARRRGFHLYLLSGDRASAVRALGLELGFQPDEIMAQKSPEQKAACIKALTTDGRQVMMVGDGVNDAVAMKLAALSVSVHGSADMAIEAADIYLAKSDLSHLLNILDVSKYHFQSVRMILSISLLYNVIAISTAMTNHIYPLVAALIMPLSSLTVISVAWIRKGDQRWKSSTLSCPLP